MKTFHVLPLAEVGQWKYEVITKKERSDKRFVERAKDLTHRQLMYEFIFGSLDRTGAVIYLLIVPNKRNRVSVIVHMRLNGRIIGFHADAINQF